MSLRDSWSCCFKKTSQARLVGGIVDGELCVRIHGSSCSGSSSEFV